MARTKQEPRKGGKEMQRRPIDREEELESVPVEKPPSILRFVLVTLLSLATSLALRFISSPFSRGDLAGVTTQRDDWPEIAGFIGWRVAELATAWWSNYDGEKRRLSISPQDLADDACSLGCWISDVFGSSTLLFPPGALLRHSPVDCYNFADYRCCINRLPLLSSSPSLPNQ